MAALTVPARVRLDPSSGAVQSPLTAFSRAAMNSGDHGKPGNGTRLRPGRAQIKTRTAIVIDKAVSVFRMLVPHCTSSHSPGGGERLSWAVKMMILPPSVTTRCTAKPAFTTPLTALVMAEWMTALATRMTLFSAAPGSGWS